jgi:hypothetical protein
VLSSLQEYSSVLIVRPTLHIYIYIYKKKYYGIIFPIEILRYHIPFSLSLFILKKKTSDLSFPRNFYFYKLNVSLIFSSILNHINFYICKYLSYFLSHACEYQAEEGDLIRNMDLKFLCLIKLMVLINFLDFIGHDLT